MSPRAGDQARPATADRTTPEGSAATQPVDARRPPPTRRPTDEPRERVIAEWYSDRPAPPVTPADRRATQPQRPTDNPFTKASEAADRAIEQQTVPARYADMVRRVFQGFSQQAAAPAPSPPPTPATQP